MTIIRCPHCQETGCDGRCRFRLGRRGFLGLGLGALAAAVLPGAPVSPMSGLMLAEDLGLLRGQTYYGISRASYPMLRANIHTVGQPLTEAKMLALADQMWNEGRPTMPLSEWLRA